MAKTWTDEWEDIADGEITDRRSIRILLIKKMKFMNFSRVLKMPSEFYFEIRYINFDEKLQSHLLSRRNAQQ